MNKKAIVFDKDGTLIDFDAFWISVSVFVINDILKGVNREDIPIEPFLNALGIKDGSTDIDGVLCKGTYEEIGIAICEVLNKYGCDKPCEDIVSMVLSAYNRNADKGVVKPTCDNITEVLKRLKSEGRKLLVVTTDNDKITDKCLRELGVKELFDYIFTDDGKTPVKPNPYCIREFCIETGIKSSEIVMVGDTMTDIKFARNADVSVIGVGKSEENRQRLSSFADFVIPDISHVFEVLEGEKEL